MLPIWQIKKSQILEFESWSCFIPTTWLFVAWSRCSLWRLIVYSDPALLIISYVGKYLTALCLSFLSVKQRLKTEFKSWSDRK
jgi:hypothetical protein